MRPGIIDARAQRLRNTGINIGGAQQIKTDDIETMEMITASLYSDLNSNVFNNLTPNGHYIGRTAQLTSQMLHFIYLFNKYTY